MSTAKDIMVKDVLTVGPDTSVIEAIDMLLENRISGLPVVDGENNLVGVVSEKDFLNILFEKDLDVKSTIKDYMTKKAVGFGPDDNVVDVCEFFLRNNFRRAPIVDNGKLLGIISRRDILKYILIAVVSKEE